MKFEKTFITFTSIWLIFNLLIEWQISLVKDRNELYIFVDFLLLISLLILAFNFFIKIYTNKKNKTIYTIASTLLFYPILWLITYSFLPYGNHLMISMNKNQTENLKILHSQKISQSIIIFRGVSCDLPLLTHEGFRIQTYSAAKKGAIAILINLHNTLNINNDQKQSLQTHIFKTIQKCDVNTMHNGLSPLINAITTNNYDITFALLRAGADSNQLYVNKKKGYSLTPLYFAELYLKSAKTDESEQSLIKIIELLKQAGARSEKVELPAK